MLPCTKALEGVQRNPTAACWRNICEVKLGGTWENVLGELGILRLPPPAFCLGLVKPVFALFAVDLSVLGDSLWGRSACASLFIPACQRFQVAGSLAQSVSETCWEETKLKAEVSLEESDSSCLLFASRAKDGRWPPTTNYQDLPSTRPLVPEAQPELEVTPNFAKGV